MSIDLLPIRDNHRPSFGTIDMPPRILLGAGPANAHPRVLQAMTAPLVGHLDPTFLKVMEEISAGLRYTFQTDNDVTLAISGTGSAAMESGLANLIEPGDVVLVGVAGYFSKRMVEMAGRYGADVRTLEKTWGQSFSLDELRAGLETHRPSLLALVHAETSTGARQPLEGVAELCRAHNCLLLVDAVTSLSGVPLLVDEWGIDVAYSGAQKCLSCPPGASPITFGPRAMEKVHGRKVAAANWYMNPELLGKYWFGPMPRAYHHTAPMNMFYALREGLRLVAEEGLAARWARHQATAELFWAGLEEIGLECHVDRSIRLPSLTTVRVPPGVDAAAVGRRLLTEYNIEIAGGLGELAGKVWRVGLMGFNSRRENVTTLLGALREVLGR